MPTLYWLAYYVFTVTAISIAIYSLAGSIARFLEVMAELQNERDGDV
jgi:hypothetical protein